jgi:hypothetical protein
MADPFVDDGGVDLPNFVTHYHLADRRPFLNLCDLTDDELDAVLADIGVPSPAWTNEHRDWRTWPRRAFVEVQLWSDEPVRAFLG